MVHDSSKDIKAIINLNEDDAKDIISNYKDEEIKAMAELLKRLKSKDILKQGYKRPVITEDTIKNIKEHPEFYVGVPVVIATGRIYMDEEFKKRSDEILSLKLPDCAKSPVLKNYLILKRINM